MTKKLIRILAATLTALAAVGVVALPASAATTEETMCQQLASEQVSLAEDLEDAQADLDDAQDDLAAANTALLASSAELGEKGLAYVRAVDNQEESGAAETAFTTAATVFAQDVVDLIDASDAHAEALLLTGLSASVLNYYNALCPD